MRDLILKFNDDQYPDPPDPAPSDSLVHNISRHDAALLIGVSSIESICKDYISGATENDIHSMQDIFIDLFGLKPSSVQTLSALSQQKATTRTIKKSIGNLTKGMKRGSALFLYISAPCWVKNGECVIPTQEYNKKGAHDFGIYMDNLEKLIRQSKAEFVILILDCDNSGEFAKPLVESCKRLNKHLYLLCSQQNFGRSLADEKILKHGYLTFFLKFYLRRLKYSSLSLQDLTDFLKKYTTPLSRFAYHPRFKQANQVPTLIHRGDRAGDVETDGGAPTSLFFTDKSSVKWRELLLKTDTYKIWLPSREEDATLLLADKTFSKTQLFLHVYLTCLKTFALLLFELDRFHLTNSTEEDLERLSASIISVVGEWLGGIAHTEHDRWEQYEGLEGMDRDYVVKGLKEGSSVVFNEMKESKRNEEQIKDIL